MSLHTLIRTVKQYRTIILGVALVMLALAARLIPGPRTIDDAFITFRYARNILSGAGFVFNPGQPPVMGTSTPLYTLLMALAGLIGGGPSADFPVIAWILNAFADAAICLVLWRCGKHLQSEITGIAAGLVWAIAPFSVAFSIGGLETSVYVLLLTAAFLAHLETRRTLAAACAIAAVLTRPDAVILIGLLVIDRVYQVIFEKDRVQASELIVFFLPGLTWLIFATLYFGSPIPHSVLAKLQVYRLGPLSALIRLVQHYATPFLESTWAGPLGIGIGLIAYPFLYIVGALRAWGLNRRFWPLMLYPWIYFFIFAIPNPLIFRWYLTPPLPAYYLFILLGVSRLLTSVLRISKNTHASSWRYVTVAALLIIFPIASSAVEWRLHADHGSANPAPDMAYIKLELLYRDAAAFLAPQIKPGDWLAAGDVGVLGYYTQASILDTVGLNSPETLLYYPEAADHYVISYAIPARLINSEKPDWIIILEVYGRRTLLVDPQFLKTYTLIHTIPTDMYGSQGMLIFQKKS